MTLSGQGCSPGFAYPGWGRGRSRDRPVDRELLNLPPWGCPEQGLSRKGAGVDCMRDHAWGQAGWVCWVTWRKGWVCKTGGERDEKARTGVCICVGPVGPGYATLRDHGYDRVVGVSGCVKDTAGYETLQRGCVTREGMCLSLRRGFLYCDT